MNHNEKANPVLMNTILKEKDTPFRTSLLRFPAQVSDCAAAPRRAMLETKRRILRKLTHRIHKEHGFSA